jgi:hypothetical protein
MAKKTEPTGPTLDELVANLANRLAADGNPTGADKLRRMVTIMNTPEMMAIREEIKKGGITAEEGMILGLAGVATQVA